VTEAKGLWPKPSVEEAFDRLLKLDEEYAKKFRGIEKAMGELKTLHQELTQAAADTIRFSIMQRKNAEAALVAAKVPANVRAEPAPTAKGEA